MADDEIDINPRPTPEVGARLLILASLIRRLFLDEELARSALGKETSDERFDLLAWLDDSDLGEYVDPDERAVLAKPVGNLTPDDHWQISSQVQALTTLSWYLDIIPELPSLDSPDLPDGLIDRLPQPWESVPTWIESLRPKSLDDLAAQRELAEIWLWRADIEEERRAANSRERTEINLAIRETAIEATNAGLVRETLDGDLPIRDKSFKSLPPDEQEAVGLTAYHRLRALNWICGFGESWSTVPLEV